MKRTNTVIVLLTDDEFAALNSLQNNYSSTGANVTKSFLVRYGLKRLPHQSPFLVSV